MAREKKICKYLDIPFQHISDKMLSAMKRRHTKAEAMELIKRLREQVPDIALRTTLLVGYPTEAQEDIDEEGTYSAEKLSDDVPEELKEQRVARIMQIQEQISLENNLKRVGQTMRVIVDGKQGNYYVARSQYDSPEVDQEILIAADKRRLRRGCFYDVMITDAEDYDLFGEVVESRSKRSRKQ